MTDIDQHLRDGLERAAATIEAPEVTEMAAFLRAGPRGNHHPQRSVSRHSRFLLAAACLAAVAVASGTLAWRNGVDNRNVDVGATSPAAFDDLAPGWSDLDTGPVPPMELLNTAWTGEQLVVAGLVDAHPANSDVRPNATFEAFAYRPATQTWDELPPITTPTPLTYEAALRMAWIGDELVVIAAGSEDQATALGWHPGDQQWRDLGAVPVYDQTGQSAAHVSPLVWTGQRLFDFGQFAALDPVTGTWTQLPMPAGEPVRFDLLPGDVAFDGTNVVASFLSSRWVRWDAAGTSVQDIPKPTTDDVRKALSEGKASPVGVDGRIVLVTTDGTAASFDAATGQWQVEPAIPGIAATIPYEGPATPWLANVGGTVVADPFGTFQPYVLTDTGWAAVDPQPAFTPCLQPSGPANRSPWLCQTTWTDAGGVLVSWQSVVDTSQGEVPSAVHASVWVPPAVLPSAAPVPTTTTTLLPAVAEVPVAFEAVRPALLAAALDFIARNPTREALCEAAPTSLPNSWPGPFDQLCTGAGSANVGFVRNEPDRQVVVYAPGGDPELLLAGCVRALDAQWFEVWDFDLKNECPAGFDRAGVNGEWNPNQGQ